jgi:hypothetical protein
MANIVTTTKDTLRTIFDKVHRVYYFANNLNSNGSVKALSELTGGIEFPVLEDGVTFDTGEPDTSEVKLTDGTTWTSKVSQGESDISFQVSSVHATINDILMEKKTAAVISTAVQVGEFDYTGQGYSLAPKKIGGALVMVSSDGLSGVYLPNVEMFSSFNGEGGDDSTGYYNVTVTPLTDANGAGFYILTGSVHSA